MFCGKCGANNPDDAAVCGSCGAELEPKEEEKPLSFVRPVPASASPEAETETVESSSAAFGVSENAVEKTENPEATEASDSGEKSAVSKRSGILFTVLFGVAAAAVIVLTVLISGRSAQTTAVQAAEAWFKPGTVALYRLTPRAVMKAKGISRSDYRFEAKSADKEYSVALAELEASLGADVRFSVMARNKKDVDREELLALQTVYAEQYGLEVTDAAIVKVRVTAAAGGDDDTYNLRIPVVKIGRSWYLDESWSALEHLKGYNEVLGNFDLT